jgi:hypothetical protein
MVERVNGTIKNATVKATTYQNIDGMKRDLNQFLSMATNRYCFLPANFGK